MTMALFQFVGGTGHVGASLYFLISDDFQKHRRTRMNTYWFLPLLIVLATALLMTYGGSTVQAHVILGYFVWQTWHYQRQNFGLLSMTGVATKSGPVHEWERLAIDLGVMAGILGLFSKMNIAEGTFLQLYAQDLYTAGSLIICFNILIVTYTIAKDPKYSAHPIRAIFFVLGAFFYLPTFIFESAQAAVMSYALAHGWQYMVFMMYVAQRPGRQIKHQVLTLFGCFIAGGIVLSMMGDQSLWGPYAMPIFGVYLGFVMWHFVTDADIWRLREPFQRQYMNSAFPFLNSKRG